MIHIDLGCCFRERYTFFHHSFRYINVQTLFYGKPLITSRISLMANPVSRCFISVIFFLILCTHLMEKLFEKFYKFQRTSDMWRTLISTYLYVRLSSDWSTYKRRSYIYFEFLHEFVFCFKKKIHRFFSTIQ